LATAQVTCWDPITVDARIWNPQLSWLEMLMANKFQRGETDAYEFNAIRYLNVVDNLFRQAILGVADQLQEKQNIISAATTAVIICSTILYYFKPVVAVCIDLTSVLSLLATCLFFEKRKQKLLGLIDEWEHSFDERRTTFGLNLIEPGGHHA